MQAWIKEELQTADFGDVRLDDRFRVLIVRVEDSQT